MAKRKKRKKSYPHLPPAFTEELKPESVYDDVQVAALLRLKSWKSMSALRSRGLHAFSEVRTVKGAGRPLYFGRDLIAYFSGAKPSARNSRARRKG